MFSLKVRFKNTHSVKGSFLLSEKKIRADFTERYKTTAALYYQGQPPFDELIKRIALHIHKL
jgi:hypothetical protein